MVNVSVNVRRSSSSIEQTAGLYLTRNSSTTFMIRVWKHVQLLS
ncbi:hypothetical protein X801_09406 [Opisthorchis viverrini]|uniref:Uncharacterized protein n=1 Tax=Opisthorchis viverrini TaxID=6198 RepID=A0A1S8WKG2_OPIVI|nr:hypothetical protein X801_09406 [Opisthorchis viverrini]